MPDLTLIALATALACAVAAAALATSGIPWRQPHTQRVQLGGTIGVAAGFAIGCAILGVTPDWPLAEDQDRLLALVLPAVIAVEILAAIGAPSWTAWSMRFAIACLAVPVLLHGSVYLEPPEMGNDSSLTRIERWLLFAGLAAALATLWRTLIAVARQQSSRTLPLALAIVSCGAGLAIMLSGYASGGQLGIILGGALAGVVIGSLVLAGAPRAEGAIGFGVVGLFSLLVVGRYFGELTTIHAALLFAAPLLTAVPVARWFPRRLSWGAAPVTLVLVLIPVGFVVAQAAQRFQQNSGPAMAPGETQAQDYLDYDS